MRITEIMDLEATQWRVVKRWASNDISRVIGLIPLAGYLILFNDTVAELLSFTKIAGGSAEGSSPFYLSSILKLRLVFFGSLLVFVSHALFRVFSPRMVDWIDDQHSFAARVLEIYSMHDVTGLEREVFATTWRHRLTEFWEFMGYQRTQPELQGYRPDVRQVAFGKNRDYIVSLAREWWVGQMLSRPWARLACLACAGLGYGMLALPTLDIAQAVLAQLL